MRRVIVIVGSDIYSGSESESSAPSDSGQRPGAVKPEVRDQMPVIRGQVIVVVRREE